MTKVSVVILNYNSDIETLNCIDSIKKSKPGFKYEIIVVENSENKTFKKRLKNKYKDIVYVKSSNYGYGAGNNLGVSTAKGKYILILNPDCLVKQNTLRVLASFLDKNNMAGAVSANMIDEKGRLFSQLGSRELTPIRGIFALSFINKIFPNNRISQEYYLSDKHLSDVREADAIPGSAFMFRKDVFEKAGGFDENLFLFFEESDLGKRIKKLGYKLFITPKTEVVHKWEVDKTNVYMQKVFNKSRFYFFKKYYGILNALLVEFFCRLSLSNILFFLILVLGVFLRFYKISSLFFLDSEIADNLLDIKNYFLGSELPLIGPPTSHPWLYFGPIFYWIYAPVLILSHFNPLSYVYFGNIFSIMALILNYFLVKKYWGVWASILSSFLVATSYFLLDYSQLSRFYSYIVLLTYVFLLLLLRFLNNPKKGIFWIFFILGVSFSFHYTPIVLIPPTIVILCKYRKVFKVKELIAVLVGLLLPLFPVIVYDSKNGFKMTNNLVLWLPYRILNTIGILHKDAIPRNAIEIGLRQFLTFLANLFSLPSNQIGLYLGVLLLLAVIIAYLKNLRYFDKFTHTLFFYMLFSSSLLIIHGDTPLHYFLLMSPFFIIFLSVVLTRLYSKKVLKVLMILYLITVVVGVVSTINRKYLRSLAASYDLNPATSYSTQKKIASFLVKDSNNMPIFLKRIGVNDAFEGNFAQNYQFLMWLYGNEPVKVGEMIIKGESAKVEYLIVENNKYNILNREVKNIYSVGNTVILKNRL